MPQHVIFIFYRYCQILHLNSLRWRSKPVLNFHTSTVNQRTTCGSNFIIGTIEFPFLIITVLLYKREKKKNNSMPQHVDLIFIYKLYY